MGGTHDHAVTGGGPSQTVLTALTLLGAAAGYLLLARRARRRNPVRSWSAWRTAFFLAGLGMLALALLPPLASDAAQGDFRSHMVQHLAIGMYAPLALVLAAPVTLLLRTLPGASALRVTAVLRSRPAQVLAHPAVALTLSTGSFGLLYFTPLFNTAMQYPAGHWLMVTHFLASGTLFAYVMAGPDPAPIRPRVPARLVYLGGAVAAHALIAQAMYGGFFVHIHAPIRQVQQGAEIMYYGGDLAELLLAVASVATWKPTVTPGHKFRPPIGT